MPQIKPFPYAFALPLLLAGAPPAAMLAHGRAMPAARAEEPPRRIVSLNLCADQYLLALADRGQIAGLTHNADKPEMSAAAAQARGLRILGQSAEEVLAIDPDLVVGMPARRSAVMVPLRNRGYRSLDLRTAESFADIVEQTRKVAAAVGNPARGEALVAHMQRELDALPAPGKGRVAAYYQRRGFLTGTGTLIDDLMRRAGLVNLAGRLGKPPLSRLSIEELVAARPDFIIVDSATDQVGDQGTEMLHHPALKDIPRIRLPQAWTVCGGPAYVQAARSLVAQVGRY
ncbi:cobalamin ABC transporter substrate-binding protein [Sphingobium jiangsuense]|uniref:Iron complex transport system substrate-binding protein n=2 Tax=Sphingobium jiangsuense TaxID=870476 RepID=A0A7W6BK83_9SPHN|nr:iron complex transport system substrate-binding protein [Sphingobium jiangsuense]GLS99152.1 cobalamin ABC transporter substrate-binding protein [Sphingobium jiangsuense]